MAGDYLSPMVPGHVVGNFDSRCCRHCCLKCLDSVMRGACTVDKIPINSDQFAMQVKFVAHLDEFDANPTVIDGLRFASILLADLLSINLSPSPADAPAVFESRRWL